jgi:hypothetical protein
MTHVLFHKTTIGDARGILKEGYSDTEWDFGLKDAQTGEEVTVTGVWLSNRPLEDNEGPEGNALLEVTVDFSDEELLTFELTGMMWNARLWVVPAETLNAHSRTKIVRVDPRSSWQFGRLSDEDLPEGPA